MTLQARILFAVAACAALSAVAYLSFRQEARAAAPPDAPAVGQPAAPQTPPPAPSLPHASASPIPYNELPRVAAARNEIIYTTSAMGEPMEVHPDGTVVIHDHRKVFTFADGHQEVRYARITAKPTWIPMSGLMVPAEDLAPPK